MMKFILTAILSAFIVGIAVPSFAAPPYLPEGASCIEDNGFSPRQLRVQRCVLS